MKDFSKIVEEWAMKYKPMLHEPGEASRNQRFFLISDIMEIPWVYGKDSTEPRLRAYSTKFMWSARISGGKVTPYLPVYFPVNCGHQNRIPRAAHKGSGIGRPCLQVPYWLRTQQDEGRRELQQLDLENARLIRTVRWWTDGIPCSSSSRMWTLSICAWIQTIMWKFQWKAEKNERRLE